MWKFHVFRAPSFFKCWVRLWKGPKDKNQALKWQLLWWEGVFQHGPQLNFRAPSSTMDLGPQLNHARFRIYYRGGTWETRRLVFRRQISCRWRCRCVLVQIIMYFDMKKMWKFHVFRAPSFFKCWVRLWKGPKDKNQALKWQLLWWEGVFQHGPQLNYRAPSSTMDLGPQLNHARFRIYYRGGTWETRTLVFRRQISCRWRCRCVLVQIIMYFDMEKNVKIPCFSRPLIFQMLGTTLKRPER